MNLTNTTGHIPHSYTHPDGGGTVGMGSILGMGGLIYGGGALMKHFGLLDVDQELPVPGQSSAATPIGEGSNGFLKLGALTGLPILGTKIGVPLLMSHLGIEPLDNTPHTPTPGADNNITEAFSPMQSIKNIVPRDVMYAGGLLGAGMLANQHKAGIYNQLNKEGGLTNSGTGLHQLAKNVAEPVMDAAKHAYNHGVSGYLQDGVGGLTKMLGGGISEAAEYKIDKLISEAGTFRRMLPVIGGIGGGVTGAGLGTALAGPMGTVGGLVLGTTLGRVGGSLGTKAYYGIKNKQELSNRTKQQNRR